MLIIETRSAFKTQFHFIVVSFLLNTFVRRSWGWFQPIASGAIWWSRQHALRCHCWRFCKYFGVLEQISEQFRNRSVDVFKNLIFLRSIVFLYDLYVSRPLHQRNKIIQMSATSPKGRIPGPPRNSKMDRAKLTIFSMVWEN